MSKPDREWFRGAAAGYTAAVEMLDKCESCGQKTHGDEDVDDSCWGFYGDDLQGMKEHVDPKYHAELEKAWANRG